MGAQIIFVNGNTGFTNYKQLVWFLLRSGVYFSIGVEVCAYVRKCLGALLDGLVLIEHLYFLSAVFSDLENKKGYLYD